MLLHDFSSFVRTSLESNKIGRVGECAPLEGRWVLRGLSEGWGRGRSTDVERTNRQTGMHRPWGDFCVYRSALTPGAENEHGVQRAKGMRAPSVLCLPFPPSLAELHRPFFYPAGSSLIVSQGSVQPCLRRESVISTPLRELSKFSVLYLYYGPQTKAIFILWLPFIPQCLFLSVKNVSLIKLQKTQNN